MTDSYIQWCKLACFYLKDGCSEKERDESCVFELSNPHLSLFTNVETEFS